MKNNVELVPSGISFLDEAWGGVYSGGSYLVVGPRRSGRTSLGLQFASQSGKEGCVYFTTSRPRNLMIQSAALDLDLERHMQRRSIRVVRIAPPAAESGGANTEADIADRIAAIEQHVLECKPKRVVFDELTPFTGGDGGGALSEAFARTVESFEGEGVTSMFIIGEPVAPEPRSVTESLVREATASIYLQRTMSPNAAERPGGKMLIVPNVGHPEGQFVARYFVEPQRPLQMESRESWLRMPLREERAVDQGRPWLLETSPGHAHESPGSDPGAFLAAVNHRIERRHSADMPVRVAAFRVNAPDGRDSTLMFHQVVNAVQSFAGPEDTVWVHRNMIMLLDGSSEVIDIHTMVAGRLDKMFRSITGVMIHIEAPFRDPEQLFAHLENRFQNDTEREAS
jgi:circadian clock protein KaiC